MPNYALRAPLRIALVGRAPDRKWRRTLDDPQMIFPQSGPYDVAFADLTGADDVDEAIEAAEGEAGALPVVALIALSDRLPSKEHPRTTLVRLPGSGYAPLVQALKRAGSQWLYGQAVGLRYRAMIALGHPFAASRIDNENGPAALLSDPRVDIGPILSEFSWRQVICPLTSSHTLRLLEGDHASALLIHLGDGLEHRLPVLKLIRRQSDLSELPVGVISERWTEEAAKPWLDAGVDLIAHTDEVGPVLTNLSAASRRFKAQRAARYSLSASGISDCGTPSPLCGLKTFRQIVQEHSAVGDPVAYGMLQLRTENGAAVHDIDEAVVYLAMALTPIDMACRPRPDLFMVAMPYADRHYAGRTTRTLATLIEDLKFGDDAEPALLAAHIAVFDRAADPKEAERLLTAEIETKALRRVLA